MPLHNTLENIVEMVRAEARLSTNSSRGTDHAEYIKQLVRRYYQTLADEFEWAHLQITRENAGKDLAAGQRYYDLPTTLNPDQVRKVWSRHSDNWIELQYGIDPSKYNEIDSDRDERYDPPLQWQWYGDQIEVWPMPSYDQEDGLRFEGGKKINPLTTDSDTCDIDDILITLAVAAEVMIGTKQPDAEAKSQAFTRRLFRLRAQRADRTRYTVGRGAVDATYEVPRINVAYVRTP